MAQQLHYITLEELNTRVIREVKCLASRARTDKKEFIEGLIKGAENELARANAKVRKELDETTARVEELNILTRNLYEGRVFGKITDAVFTLLSTSYNEEFKELP